MAHARALLALLALLGGAAPAPHALAQASTRPAPAATPQPEGGPATAPPAEGLAPAPPPAATTDELPPPPPPSYEAPPPASCTPACRTGYVCHDGQCVSACNPPCAADEACNASGQCELRASPAAPAFPVPGEPPIPPIERGVEQHDGFMLRLTLGFGGGGASLEPDDPGGLAALGLDTARSDLSGGGGSFSIDVGGAPTENLIIHGRISDFVLVDPTLSIDESDQGELAGTVGMILFGPAITYYFMPINLYLTAAIGVGGLRIEEDGDDPRGTDAGFALNLDVGKEWWVGDNWGLGIAARFAAVSGTDESDAGFKTDYSMTSFALLFSATYQ